MMDSGRPLSGHGYDGDTDAGDDNSHHVGARPIQERKPVLKHQHHCQHHHHPQHI